MIERVLGEYIANSQRNQRIAVASESESIERLEDNRLEDVDVEDR